MVIIKLGTTCAIYPRLENRVEVELWYFKFQVLANTVRKCRVIHQQDAVLERITVGFFDKFSLLDDFFRILQIPPLQKPNKRDKGGFLFVAKAWDYRKRLGHYF